MHASKIANTRARTQTHMHLFQHCSICSDRFIIEENSQVQEYCSLVGVSLWCQGLTSYHTLSTAQRTLGDSETRSDRAAWHHDGSLPRGQDTLGKVFATR